MANGNNKKDTNVAFAPVLTPGSQGIVTLVPDFKLEQTGQFTRLDPQALIRESLQLPERFGGQSTPLFNEIVRRLRSSGEGIPGDKSIIRDRAKQLAIERTKQFSDILQNADINNLNDQQINAVIELQNFFREEKLPEEQANAIRNFLRGQSTPSGFTINEQGTFESPEARARREDIQQKVARGELVAKVDPKTGATIYVPPGSPAETTIDTGRAPASGIDNPRTGVGVGGGETGGLPSGGQVNSAAQNATNLFQFYTAQGQDLPSLSDRAQLYEQLGLGSQSEYIQGNRRGDPTFNNRLLAKLKSGAFPSTTATGGQERDPETIIQDINAQANQTQNDEAEKLEREGVDIRVSSEISDVIETLADEEAPEVPDLVAEFNKQRSALGVGALEDELASVDAQIAQLEANFASTIESEEARRVSTKQIGRRLSEGQIAFNREKRDLEVKRGNLVNQLNTKYGVINTIMSLTGQDFQNANSQYQFSFNKNIALSNLLLGISDREKSDAERAQDNARANVQVMYDLIKSGGVSYDNLSSATKIDIKNMELQAGLPVGFVDFISRTIDGDSVSFLSQFTDANGNRVLPVVTKGGDGSYSINNVNLGTVKTSTTDLISQSKLNTLAAAGVPNIVALDIQASLNAGVDEATVKQHLINQFGQATGSQYMDSFISVMQAGGGATVVFPS